MNRVKYREGGANAPANVTSNHRWIVGSPVLHILISSP